MPGRRGRASHVSRRVLIHGILTGAVGGVLCRTATAEDQVLQAQIDTQGSDFGQSFNSASRTVHMPKLPTLSRPQRKQPNKRSGNTKRLSCAAVGRPRRPANSCASATASPAYKPFAARGDLDVNAGIGDIFDSYVEAAVRRFQARHGLPSMVSSANRLSTRST
jgi:L,D-transpeptidase YcbB